MARFASIIPLILLASGTQGCATAGLWMSDLLDVEGPRVELAIPTGEIYVGGNGLIIPYELDNKALGEELYPVGDALGPRGIIIASGQRSSAANLKNRLAKILAHPTSRHITGFTVLLAADAFHSDRQDNSAVRLAFHYNRTVNYEFLTQNGKIKPPNIDGWYRGAGYISWSARVTIKPKVKIHDAERLFPDRISPRYTKLKVFIVTGRREIKGAIIIRVLATPFTAAFDLATFWIQIPVLYFAMEGMRH